MDDSLFPVVKKVVEEFMQWYPQLDVAGYRNGYYTEDQEPDIVEMVRKSNADILFVGFSSPKKEKFLNRWMPMSRYLSAWVWAGGLILLPAGQSGLPHGCKRAVWNGATGYTRNQEGCGSAMQRQIRCLCGWWRKNILR